MEEKRYGYIYEITFPDGKVYVGKHTPKHKGEAYNWYMGSGNYVKNFLKEHSKDELTKKLLVEGEFTIDELNKLEVEYVSKYKQLPNCVNKARGGDGGDTSKFINYKYRNQQASIDGYKKWLLEHREEVSNRTKHYWSIGIYDNVNFSHTFTEEQKQKISESQKGSKNSQYGTHWYTDGEKNVKAKECPPGFKPGRI